MHTTFLLHLKICSCVLNLPFPINTTVGSNVNNKLTNPEIDNRCSILFPCVHCFDVLWRKRPRQFHTRFDEYNAYGFGLWKAENSRIV